MEPLYKEPPTTDFSTYPTLQLSTNELRKYTGHYWSEVFQTNREVIVKDDTLRYVGRSNLALLPVAQDRFRIMLPGDNKLFVEFDPTNKSYKYLPGDSDPVEFNSYIPEEKTPEEMQKYIGQYVNQEFGIVYKLPSGTVKARACVEGKAIDLV